MMVISHPAFAAFYALFVWWFSTGAVLYVVGLPASSSRGALVAAVGVFAAVLFGLACSGADTSVGGVYLAFTSAILLWGTQEFVFLTGFIVGPHTRPCPEGCIGWRRAWFAIEAILYHEIALLLSGICIVAATWSADNQFGAWTFLILWAMRISAKLNLFFGVPVLNEEFLPRHLEYVGSFFKKAPVSLLFPISVTGIAAAMAIFFTMAMAGAASPSASVGYILLCSLTGLGLLEHWFMVLPFPVVALWSWGMRSRGGHITEVQTVSLAENVRGQTIVKRVPNP